MGLIPVHAKYGFIEQSGKNQRLFPFPAIDARVLHEWGESEYKTTFSFWMSNDAEMQLHGRSSYYAASVVFRYFGIRFEPTSIFEMLPAEPAKGFTAIAAPPPATTASTSATAPTSTTAKHAGGAPKKEFWDDLWAAIAAKLYNGDLKPTKQADIEKAMLDWATANTKDGLSEATARTRASKLWKLIREADN